MYFLLILHIHFIFSSVLFTVIFFFSDFDFWFLISLSLTLVLVSLSLSFLISAWSKTSNLSSVFCILLCRHTVWLLRKDGGLNCLLSYQSLFWFDEFSLFLNLVQLFVFIILLPLRCLVAKKIPGLNSFL